MSSFFSTYVFPSRPTLNYWEKSVSLSLAQRDYERGFGTKAGRVKLKMPKLKKAVI